MNRHWRVRPMMQPLSIALFFLWASASAAEERPLRGVALVIGNGDYEHLADLPNPANDARAIDDLLADLGFDTSVSSDRDGKRLRRDLERFAEDAEGADVAILYYSGHGIEAAGENWLVPVDADLSSLRAAGEKLVPLTDLVEEVRAGVSVVIVMLDACRSNPFPADALLQTRPGAPAQQVTAAGLGRPRGAVTLAAPDAGGDATLGTVIGFAAEPGSVALDGAPGSNSPYAAALLKHLGAGGAAFSDIMTMVTEEVYLETGGRQRPWTNVSLRRLLYFGRPVEQPADDDARLTGARRELLLTIAATPGEMRGFVEALAAEDELPLDQLYGMLKELDVDTDAGPEQLEQQLRSGAENLKRFMAERVMPARTDPELVRLSGLADRAQDEGAIGLAKHYREKASARAQALASDLDDREDELRADRLQLAATFAEHAETAILAFDQLTAARQFEAAARQAGRWDPTLALDYAVRAADALTDFGRFKGDRAALEQAVGRYDSLLSADRRGPMEWAAIQNNLGNALRALGELESGTERLEAAVDAYRSALQRHTRTDSPLKWAATQNNLGNALSDLGEREGGTARLDEAIAAYRAALEETPRERLPFDWAATQNNLGTALRLLGRRESGTGSLELAATAFRSTLQVYTRERFPLRWATTQTNLGNVLRLLGEREGSRERFRQAAALFRAALEERPRKDVPLDWAATQHSLGAVLLALGQAEGDTATLVEATAAFNAALKEYTRDRAPLEWGKIKHNLATALQAIGEREDSTARLAEAVDAYKAALEERTRARAPLEWAMTQNNLGTVLLTLGERESDPARLREAADAFRAAMEEHRRERAPLDWAMAQSNLGNTLLRLGQRASGTGELELAVAAYRSALEELTRARVPLHWSGAQHNLGSALQLIGQRTTGTWPLEQAVTAYKAALEERLRERVPLDWAATQNALGATLLQLALRLSSLKLAEQGKLAIEQAWEQDRMSGLVQYEAYYSKRIATAERLVKELRKSLPGAAK